MPVTTEARPISFTLEDVAHFVDGAGELPKDTAARLRALIRCDDLNRVESTWDLIRAHRADLRRMADDAGVELLVDAVFVFRIFERLRSETWESPGDLLHDGVEVPYQQLIALVGAHAERAEGDERQELLRLKARLTAVVGDQLGSEGFVELLIDRLLEVGEELAEKTLDRVAETYRHRRAVGTEKQNHV